MATYRIVIADDHSMFRGLLKKVLGERKDFATVGEAANGLDLLRVVKEEKPDLVILDISMPQLRGIEAIHEIKAIRPEAKILILTMHKDPEFLRQAMAAGADGYLLKEEGEDEVFSAVETLRKGKTYISPLLSEVLTDQFARLHRGEVLDLSDDPLTLREKEVLKLIAEGKSNREIADLLFISVHTVERHRAHIMEKLGIRKIADLVRYAIQKRYI